MFKHNKQTRGTQTKQNQLDNVRLTVPSSNAPSAPSQGTGVLFKAFEFGLRQGHRDMGIGIDMCIASSIGNAQDTGMNTGREKLRQGHGLGCGRGHLDDLHQEHTGCGT